MRAEVAKAESPTNDNNSEAEADQNVTVVPSPPLCESTHIEDAPWPTFYKQYAATRFLSKNKTAPEFCSAKADNQPDEHQTVDN